MALGYPKEPHLCYQYLVLSATTREKLVQADQIHRQAARMHPDPFMEYVLQDEETGAYIKQAAIHREWHRMISENKRVLIWSSVESGKTQQIAIGRTLWELGRNQNLRCAVVSNTQGQASKIVGAVARYIEQSAELLRVFPELKKGGTWTSYQLVLERPIVSKDPSLQAFGVHGNVLGARIDLLILDDILDYENCRTPAMRQDLWDWIHATLWGRLTKDARVITIGTAFHPDDVLHRFARSPVWASKRFPAIDPQTSKSRWPEKWSPDRIEEKRVELGPVEFARQMLCVARDDTTSRFKQEWVDKALARGKGKRLEYALERVPNGCKVYTGVDLGVQRHAAAGSTVLFTLLIHPNGDRQVLNIESGKWSGPDIINRIYDHNRRYMCIHLVENNAAQDFILQFANERGTVPILPFTTGKNKASPEFGVESIAAEMAGGKWIIPCNEDGSMDPEVSEWITEMLYYDPTAHTGDRLMASWFAREGDRQKPKARVEYAQLDLMRR